MEAALNKATLFKNYHHDSSVLILPNAWDVMSAKIYEKMDYKAIGTTSAGIAASLGYKDGEQIPFELMLDVIKQITNSVNIPVSADIESGYGETIEEVIENVKKVIDIGVVGINLEDSIKYKLSALYDIEFQQKKIERIKNLSISEGIPLFINARTDVYWLNLYDNKIKETIERATAYKAAGADGIFIPGLTNEETIKIFTEEIRLPINILAESSTPTILDLNHLNVKRLSFGSGAYRATVSNIQKIACEVMKQGHYKRMTNNSMSYEDMMDLLK